MFRNNLSKIGLLFAISLLHLGFIFSIIPISLSDSFVSAERSISQDYLVHDPIHITGDNQLAAVANNGTGTSSNPYIIAGWKITGAKTHGIYISGTTKHFRIEDCWIDNFINHGIFVDDVTPGTTIITNNTCNNNGWNGINLGHSGSSTITNNTCNNNNIGIYLGYSESSIIANNSCYNNRWFGIGLGDSGSSTVTNNTCINNSNEGIVLEYSGFLVITNNTCHNSGIYLGDSESSIIAKNTCTNCGIDLGDSKSSVIVNNTCNNNNGNGIDLWYSDYSLIVWNTLRENGGYGIELSEYSVNNSIHHNSFISNGQEISQACDHGMNNQWYDETVLEGNSWSDYNGSGSYMIAGSAGASDPYPASDLYTSIPSETDINGFIFLLFRIGLFVFVCGLVLVISLVNRRNKSV